MKQVQYNLPDNWYWKLLDDISEKITDGTHHSPKVQYSEWELGRFKYITSKNIKNYGMKLDNISYIDENVHNEIHARCAPELEDQLLTKDGAMTGTCCLNELDEQFSLLSSVALIKQNRSVVLPKYLNYYLQSNVGQSFLLGDISGAAITRTNIRKLKSIPVPLAPIAEQEHIVEKLDALLSRIDTATENLQESIILADELAQNGIDAYFAELSTSVVPLSELVNFISGYAFKSGDFLSESGIKPIKITNVGVNEFSENKEEFLPTSYRKEFDRFAVKENDIVIALTRPIINGGLKVCRVPETYSGALVNQRVAAITSDNENLLNFIYLYLQSSRTKNYILEKSKSLNQPNLSITDLKNLTLPVPSGSEAILKAVIDCEALILKARRTKAEIIEKISLLSKLKNSILDSAFKGEL